MYFNETEKNNFFDAVDSLKKYRRAELIDEKGNNLLEKLYTDLLPNNQVLKTCLKDNTTFLIGRKGTGKSTIFLKLQQEIRKNDKKLSCYIDTNYVFESSKSESILLDYLKDIVSADTLQKYLLERTFIQNILKAIRSEIDKKSYTILDKLKMLFGSDKSEIVKNKLKNISKCIENNEILKEIELPIIKETVKKTKESLESSKENGVKVNSGIKAQLSEKSIGLGAQLKGGVSKKEARKEYDELENSFSEIFLKVFQIKDIISDIKEILSLLEINSLVILLDDFSEIDDSSMRTFVDVVLAPLNNWSDEFIKFKIAAYPTRLYYGKIDTGKIDIIDLDFYNLYSEFDRNTMEERAIDFTKRLIDKRIQVFSNKTSDFYFDVKNQDIIDYFELIFQISSNVPRIIGYILFYCYESNIVFDKPINRSALEAAAQKYYNKIISKFFDKTTYSMMAFEEKISALQLKELVGKIAVDLSNIRKRIVKGDLRSVVYDENRTNPYTSHFYFNPNYEKFLRTLELNFFITKYDEMSDRDGAKQSVFALNYGLCIETNLRWGKPKGTKHRKYFIARPFDFNKSIDDFLKTSKKIVCINPDCAKSYPFEQLKFLEFNKMKCPECQYPVEILSNAETLKEEIKKIDNSKLLPPIEYSILYELNNSETPPRAKEIAEELDCSYQLIGAKAKKLDENKGLINREWDEYSRRIYILTENALKDYFS